MPTFKVEGKTLENSLAAQNLVIAYKANRDDPAADTTIGTELGRDTADVDGNFLITFDDYDEDIFLVVMDPSDTVKYEAKIVDWLRPQLSNYDPYYENVVTVARMEGANGGTSFVDEIGNTTFVSSGTVVTSTDQVKFGNTSAKFDRTDTDSELSGSHGGNLDLLNKDFCFEVFAYFNNLTGIQAIMSNRNPADETNYTYYVFAEGSTLKFYFSTNEDGSLLDSTAGTLTADTWHHIAMVRNGPSVQIYLDGVKTGETIFTQFSTAETSPGPLQLGWENNDQTRVIDGYLDSFRATIGTPRYTENFVPLTSDYPTDVDRYYHRVEILLHMEGADDGTVFTCQKGSVCTPVGSCVTSIDQFKYGSTSFYNPNATSRLQIQNESRFSMGSKDWTIEAWVYQNGDSWYKTIASKRPSGAGYCEFVFRISNTEALEIYLNNNGSWVSAISANSAVPTNQWAHVAVSRRGSTIRGFVDGVEVCSVVNTFSVTPDTNDIVMGSEGDTNRLIGYIDEFRYTVGAARYTTNFTPLNRAFQDS